MSFYFLYCIYAILQQIYVQFRLDLEINVLLMKYYTLQELLFVCASFRFQSYAFIDVVILLKEKKLKKKLNKIKLSNIT